ncbi:hypothetical protein GQ44DRAFT_831895 [Phaeosphaeriaceae sp. PMI808]|nr:hypothetical protein GQ44DRAFT_831895 [Phaeosphaeriaceae sp. PMI808]
MANKVDNGKEAVVLRKFGINETYQLAMYLLDQYRSTVLSCRYAFPPRLAAESRTQIEKVIKVAVASTIMRHPMMQVGMIDGTSKTPSWIQLPSLDLSQHIKWIYLEGGDHNDFEQRVQGTFRTQLDERFPDLETWAKQPGWKITIVRLGDTPILEILLAFNHPQFDGAGAKIWHEDFFEILNTANTENGAYKQADLDGDILRLPKAPPMLPTSLENLKSLPLDPKFLVKSLWEEFKPQIFNRLSRDVSQAAWCPIPLCRQNKTTITGLLNGLSLIAFSLHLDSTAAPAFQSSTVMDHRRNLPAAPPDAPWGSCNKVVSNYVTQVLHRFNTEVVARIRSKLPATCDGNEGIDMSAELQHELWAVSAQNRLEIVRKMEDPLRNDIVGLFQYVTDWQKTMSDMAKKTRQFSWLVTNVGVLNGVTSEPGNDDQKWSIDRAQFGLGAEIPAAAIEISPVSVAGRGMCVSADWPDNAVDVVFGERIMADLERWLAQLASQQSPCA